VVIQFNKRDLPDTKSDDEIEEIRQRGRQPVIGAVAIRCEGVLETLHSVLQLAYCQLDTRSQLSKHIGLDETSFLGQIFSRIDVGGTQLERDARLAAAGAPSQPAEESK